MATAGDTITFRADASDLDGNLSGVTWYGINPTHTNQYVGQSGVSGNGSSATFTQSITFNSFGSYNIHVQAFDTEERYSETITWTINVQPDNYERAIYIDDFEKILGNLSEEELLLAFLEAYNFTEIALYGLHHVLPSRSKSLKNFIKNAREHFSIEKVVGVGGTEADFTNISHYNASNPGYEFDGILLEYEYWNQTPKDYNRYIELLSAMRIVADQESMTVDTYMGWLTQGAERDEAAGIADLVDTVYLHCYRAIPTDAYLYCSGRMEDFSDPNAPVTIRPIYSAEWRPVEACEGTHTTGVDNMCFMGEWIEQNPNLDLADSIFIQDYTAANPAWSSGVLLSSKFQYFAYTHLANALPKLEYNFRPHVSITHPESDIAVGSTQATYSISGLANDADGTVGMVEYRSNGGAWGTASGTDAWQVTISLVEGENVVEVRSRDDDDALSLFPHATVTILRSSAVDSDGDNVPDHSDNCPFVANPDQQNLDGDGEGDACDDDDDNDGRPDATDPDPLVAEPNHCGGISGLVLRESIHGYFDCRAERDIAVEETNVKSDGNAVFVAGESVTLGEQCSVVAGGRMRVVIMENPAP